MFMASLCFYVVLPLIPVDDYIRVQFFPSCIFVLCLYIGLDHFFSGIDHVQMFNGYKLYQSLLGSQFPTDTIFICLNTSFIRQYWLSIFHYSGSPRTLDPCRLSLSVVHPLSARVCGLRFWRASPAHHSNHMRDWGRGSREEVKLFGRWREIIFAQIYFGVKFIVPVLDRNLTHSQDRTPAKDWVGGRRKACTGKILWLLSQFIHYSTCTRGKMVLSVSHPWVDSIYWVEPGPLYQASRQWR